MTMSSPTIPGTTTREDTIASNSQGPDESSKAFIELSNAEMQLFKADMEASKAEASLGKAEARIAKYCGITTILILLAGVATLVMYGRKFVPQS